MCGVVWMHVISARCLPKQMLRKLREYDRLIAESVPFAEVTRHLEMQHQRCLQRRSFTIWILRQS